MLELLKRKYQISPNDMCDEISVDESVELTELHHRHLLPSV